jgi:hypothetical protein
MESTVKLYSLNYKEAKTYLFATLFVLGNIALPQLCHLIPQGGFIFLPIYFFTLIGAYKYGMRVGLLTAILSPIINCLLFGMPALAMLPAILVKSVVLAIAAALIAHRAQKVSLLLMFAVVLTYQFVGSIFEAIQTGNITASLQDVRLGLPGLLFQIFGGWAFIRFLIRK